MKQHTTTRVVDDNRLFMRIFFGELFWQHQQQEVNYR